MRFISAILICILSTFTLSAQEMWGIANSNYAGNMGMHLNPASMVGAPYKYELNILAGDLFFENNYVYWKTFPAMMRGDRPNDYYTSPSKHAYHSGLILGPSYILNKGDRAFAIHTAIRSVASANNVSTELAKSFYDGFHFLPQHGIVYGGVKMQAAALMFGDLGVSYGEKIFSNDNHWLGWGATLRGIIAFSGAYAKGGFSNYLVQDSSTLIIQEGSLQYAHASANYDHSPSLGELLFIRGFGASLDGGLIYIHNRQPQAYKCDKDADKAKRYDYRLGLSLMDLGYVSFFKDASKFEISDKSTIWNGIDTLKINSLTHLDQMVSAQFEGSPTASKTGNKFGMLTPLAASLQFDYCFKPRWYTSLSVVQRLPISFKEVYRANQVALVPRYEMRRFEVSASAHVYEYEHFSVGAAVRWWIFVFGSDRLLSFFSNEVNSFDFFFGFKYNSCSMNVKKKKAGQCPFD